ncbi:hypothetical protein FEM41_19840 [Jejubacter calystegiae]|uniref:Lipoprotein n=1 Tax=Jejubacter calystegiae TaxID=2579935 RepID=A0A4P8YSI6_9ENTR|nr:hypothetical protein [Jejubacter calystegiae]QCT21742.1 hypothetical protein FEM41_19840 [Jejubacter calystegiae]
MKKLAIIGFAALVLSGCANQPKLIKETQSGKPEGFYTSTTKEKVKDALINYCNNQGLTIYGADNSSVICGREQQGGSAIFTQALIGNAYSTTPVSKVRFTISQINNDVKVWADMWVETQMAMGQVQQMQVTSNDVKNIIQQRLDAIKP